MYYLVNFQKEIIDLPSHIIGDEKKLEYKLRNESLRFSTKSREKQSISEIDYSIRVYVSDFYEFEKSFLIKKEIKKMEKIIIIQELLC